MSVRALTWCRTVRITVVQKAVLYCLCDRADEYGASWPSIATISAEACASERAVQQALRALTDAGLIRVDRSLRKTPTYYVQIGAPAGDAPRTSCTPHHVHPAGDAPRTSCTLPPQEMHPTPHHVHPTPAGDAPKASLKHQRSVSEASGNPAAEHADLFGHPSQKFTADKSATKKRGRDRQSEHPDFAQWWEAYPKKVARPEAAEAYAQAIERGASPGELLIGLRNHAFTPDRQYQPHPATWLRAERWRDEPGPRPRTLDEEEEACHRAVLAAVFPDAQGEEAEATLAAMRRNTRPRSQGAGFDNAPIVIDGECWPGAEDEGESGP